MCSVPTFVWCPASAEGVGSSRHVHPRTCAGSQLRLIAKEAKPDTAAISTHSVRCQCVATDVKRDNNESRQGSYESTHQTMKLSCDLQTRKLSGDAAQSLAQSAAHADANTYKRSTIMITMRPLLITTSCFQLPRNIQHTLRTTMINASHTCDACHCYITSPRCQAMTSSPGPV